MKENPIKILLIEDNSLDVRLIRETLKGAEGAHYELRIATSLSVGVTMIDTYDEMDIILADLSLPDSSGMNTYHQIHAYAPNKPIVILTGLDDQQMAVMAVKEGAQDYVIKGDCSSSQLSRIIRYAIERNRLVIELEEKNKSLEAARGALEIEVSSRTVELQEERDLAQAYLDNAEIIVVALNPQGKIRNINRKGCQILGYSEEELLGKDWFNHCLPSEGIDSIKEVFSQLMSGQLDPVEYYENPVLTKGGEQRLIAWHNNILRDQENKIYGLFSSGQDITERKKAEDELKAHVAFLDSVMIQSPYAMWISDAAGTVIRTNKALLEALNLTDEQIIGNYNVFKDENLVEQGVVPLVKAVYEEHKPTRFSIPWAGEQAGHNEFSGVSDLWIDVSIFPVVNDDGDLVNVVCQWVDISERMRAELSLFESEAKMRSIFHVAPVGIGVVSNRVLTEVNERFCEITGYSKNELIGSSSKIIYPSDDEFEYVGSEKYRQIAINGTGTVETRFKRKDGSLIDVLLSSTPINPDDHSFGVTFTTLDITDRKQAEKAVIHRLELEQLNKKVSTSFINTKGVQLDEAIQQSLADIALFAGANRGSLFILSQDLAQITNTHEWCSNPEDSQINLLQDIPFATFGYYQKQLLAHNSIVISTLSDLPKEAAGEWEWIEEHGFRSLLFIPLLKQERLCGTLGIYGEMGEEVFWSPEFITMLEFIGDIIQNVLERKEVEEELDQYRQHLEKLVAERTAQLEAFAYSVSHDLKAPLRGIHGYSRLLIKHHADQLDDEGKLFLQNVSQAADNMRQLIDDLLEYTRMERRDIVTREVDLRGVIEALLEEFESEIKTHDVDIQVDLPCATLNADFESLAQVMRNLIDNALKYSSQSEDPRIEIGGSMNDNNCQVWVRDNGIGFDMRYQERIFEIFQRLHRVDEFPGTGVGLAIVHKAMQRMGGHVWAESEEGRGATFYLEFPRSLS